MDLGWGFNEYSVQQATFLASIIIKHTKKNLNTTKPSLINGANTSCQSLGRFSFDSTVSFKCIFRNQHLRFSALHTNVNESFKAHSYSSFSWWRKKLCWAEVCAIVFSQERTQEDPGEGPGEPGPPYFRPKWGPKGRKQFFLRVPPPPISGSGWPPPPFPPLSEGLNPPLENDLVFL